MSRLGRFLAAAFPSVPPADRALILAAMEGRTTTPAPSVCGEAALGAGGTPEGGGAPVPSPSGPPACELDVSSEPLHPFFRDPGLDDYLADLLDRWSQEAQA